MNSLDGQDELNQSKFLSEQINADEEPTEEEILERAEELGIEDLGLAKESLVKQLTPEWRPYINRHGAVYYINLQERQAYKDHPIDMEFKITDALRNKKKTPVFKYYKLEAICQSMQMMEDEIARFHRSQGLKIVYEESEEDSARKETKKSVSEEGFQQIHQMEQLNEEQLDDLDQFRREMQRNMEKQAAQYKKSRQNQHLLRIKRYEALIEQTKKRKLQEIMNKIEQQIKQKNEINLQRTMEATREELMIKKNKFEDLLQKDVDLTEQIYSSKVEIVDYKILNKQKIINKKKAIKNDVIQTISITHRQNISKQIWQSQKRFNQDVKSFLSGRINFIECIDRNMDELSKKMKESSQNKKRFSIFQSQLLQDKKNSTVNVENKLTIDYATSESIWKKDEMPPWQYVPQTRGSLSLRLMKRIL